MQPGGQEKEQHDVRSQDKEDIVPAGVWTDLQPEQERGNQHLRAACVGSAW